MKKHSAILMLEDDRVDAMTIERALKEELNLTNQITWVQNGEEGLAFLRETAPKKPGLILLDLNMPKMNGIDFLKIVRQDPGFRTIPVVVLTTSDEERDRIESFNLGVAGYMLKPVDYVQFVEVVKTIGLYWTLSEVPE